jgi:putative tricarboxylic transport membrane protein
MLLVINLPLAPAWTRLLQVPRPLLYAGIVLFAALGVYAVNGSAVDLVVLYALGLLGFTMRRFGLPVAPAIIGVILGPIAEKQLRRALAISDGDYSTLVSSPIAVGLYVVAAMVVLGPVVAGMVSRHRRRHRGDDSDGSGGVASGQEDVPTIAGSGAPTLQL